MEGIPITVQKKNIKNLYLRIGPDGAVRISAPSRMPLETIRVFAASRVRWIRQHQQRLCPPLPPPQYVPGEVFFLWGEPHPLRLVPAGGTCAAALEEGALVLLADAGSTVSQRKAAVTAWYREQLRATIPSVQRACEAIVGQHAAEVRIRDMRTRWGTCSIPRRRIWISLQLAQKPPECLRCVMTHELTHLIEPGHTPRFWTLMDQFCPDWRQIHRLLGAPHAN